MLNRRTFQSGLALGLTGLLPPVAALAGVTRSQVTPPTFSVSRESEIKEAFGASQTTLASKLISAMARSRTRAGNTVPLAEGGNILASPMGAALSMSIIALLSPDAMRRSLARALQFSDDVTDPFSDALQRSESVAYSAKADGFPLLASNLMMLDASCEPFPFTLDGMRRRGIEVDVGDLGSHDAVIRANNWVKERTKGFISTILEMPPGKGGSVALDALHFKDAWKNPFDLARSTDAPFSDIYGRTSTAKMMFGEGSFLMRRDRGLAAVMLPFLTERFSLVLATRSNRATAPAALVSDVGAWLDGSGFTQMRCELGVPRLNLAGSSDLVSPLEALGMRNDLLVGLGGKAPRLRTVAQKSLLKLDERGGEAAVATAVVASRSITTNETRIVFDKPFLFSLRDENTGFVVLAGYVGVI